LVLLVIENTIAVLIMNIVLGRQLRAARVLAGLTQRQLSTEGGFNPRACRYWEYAEAINYRRMLQLR
jgi:hypothetical protein